MIELTAIGVSIIAGFGPMLFYSFLLYRLDRYEKEPFITLAAVYCWGAVIAAGGAFLINTISSLGLSFVFQSESTAMFTTMTLVAPVVEEALKGFAVLLVYLFFQQEFDSRLDGILFAGVTALGFAATENAWYIYSLGYLPGGWKGFLDLFIIRTLWVGWQHPFYTAFIGLGLAQFRLSPGLRNRWIFPVLGFSAAIFLHTLHNLLAVFLSEPPGYLFSRAWDWTGYLGLLIFIFGVNQREKRWIKKYLAEEVEKNTLTKSQLSSLMRTSTQLAEIRKQPSRETRKQVKRFFHLAGELMHKKRQKAERIKNKNKEANIDYLRSEVRKLSRQISMSDIPKSLPTRIIKEHPDEQPAGRISLAPGKDEQPDLRN